MNEAIMKLYVTSKLSQKNHSTSIVSRHSKEDTAY